MIEVKRETKETNIELKLELYGSGQYKIETGIGFFNHMLESFSKHSLIDIDLKCIGDIHVDFHHSVEDCGIVIGQALHKELFPIKAIERFSNSNVVMDESCVECSLDISNRPYIVYEIEDIGLIGDFDIELAEEFFRALVLNAGLSVHLIKQRGKNRHHIIEAAFKALAISIRRATLINERVSIPSTKGTV